MTSSITLIEQSVCLLLAGLSLYTPLVVILGVSDIRLKGRMESANLLAAGFLAVAAGFGLGALFVLQSSSSSFIQSATSSSELPSTAVATFNLIFGISVAFDALTFTCLFYLVFERLRCFLPRPFHAFPVALATAGMALVAVAFAASWFVSLALLPSTSVGNPVDQLVTSSNIFKYLGRSIKLAMSVIFSGFNITADLAMFATFNALQQTNSNDSTGNLIKRNSTTTTATNTANLRRSDSTTSEALSARKTQNKRLFSRYRRILVICILASIAEIIIRIIAILGVFAILDQFMSMFVCSLTIMSLGALGTSLSDVYRQGGKNNSGGGILHHIPTTRRNTDSNNTPGVSSFEVVAPA